MSAGGRRQANRAVTLPLATDPVAPAGRLLVPDADSLRPRRPSVRWHWGRYVVIAAAVYSGWLGHREWIAYRRLVAEEARMAAQQAQLRQQQATLQAQIAYAGSDAYVQSEARQLFGMVGPGEVSMAPLPAGSNNPSP